VISNVGDGRSVGQPMTTTDGPVRANVVEVISSLPPAAEWKTNGRCAHECELVADSNGGL
jgi:hypothetical protein